MTEFEYLANTLKDSNKIKNELFLRNLLRDSIEVSLKELAPIIAPLLPENFNTHNPLEFDKDVSEIRGLDEDHMIVLNTYLNHKFKVRFLNELFNRCYIIRFARNAIRE